MNEVMGEPFPVLRAVATKLGHPDTTEGRSAALAELLAALQDERVGAPPRAENDR